MLLLFFFFNIMKEFLHFFKIQRKMQVAKGHEINNGG